MQQQNFPNILTAKDFKPTSDEHLQEVLSFLNHNHEKQLEIHHKTKTQNKKIQIDEKILKKLESLMKESAKIALKYPHIIMDLLKQLIAFFNDIPHPSILTLITQLLGPDMKFQAVKNSEDSNPSKQAKPQELPIIALPMAQESIIALPSSSHNIVVAKHDASDIGVQQNRQVHQKYFIEDDSKVVEYLQSPFKTVKRDGITDLFTNTVELMVNQFFDKLLQSQNLVNLHVENVIGVLKLLEYVSAPIYTYYFLTMVRGYTSVILGCFSVNSQEKVLQSVLAQDLCHKIKRTEYDDLIYAVRSLTERWTEHKSDFNVDLWEWNMEQNMIIRFLQSSTSQKQLHSVKTVIDRSRKVLYNSYSVLTQDELILFIQNNSILENIYKAQNHPEVIIKGKELFEFIAKNNGLSHYLIDLVFELIPKSNQNICKALYSTLQATGHTNLENNREYMMTKISSLPRANLFYNETFTLIEALILLAPIQIIGESLKYVYQIIYSHYFGLKPQLKHKILNIYFEVYLMGIQEGQFDTNEQKMMIVLEPFLQSETQFFSKLTFLIIDKFLQKLKEHIPKKIGPKCKKIINYCIEALFKKYKIYQKPKESDLIQVISTSKKSIGENQFASSEQVRELQLGLIKQLLEISQKQMTKGFLSEKQLWELIQEDSYFGRFLSYYSNESQLYLLEKLISKAHLTEKDIKNIIESYYFMDKEVKDKIFVQIYNMFYRTTDFAIKQKLIDFIVKVKNSSAEEIAKKVQEQIRKESTQLNLSGLLSVMMQLKQGLTQHDKQGCGSYPAFKYLTNDYSLKLKILNMIDMFNPTNFEIEQKNYRTLYDVVKRLLPILGKSLKEIKMKVDKNDKYVTLEELKEKLNTLSPYREISLTIEESNECEWYDHSLIIDKNKQMNVEIKEILKEIFNHYCEEVNNQKRLFKQGACRIFQRATNVQTILVGDMRILHMFNNYSQTGEYLTIHQWINFYYQSASMNPMLVISNLKNLGYGEVFQSANEMIQNFTLDYQNLFRQYFALNQQIYQDILGLFEKLRDRKEEETCKQMTERISRLGMEILNELPKWEEFQKEVLQKFIEKKQHEVTSKMMDEKEQSNQIEVSEWQTKDKEQIEKIYLKVMILSHEMEKLEQFYHANMEMQSCLKERVKTYGVELIKRLLREILSENKKIDGLNLSYHQEITIKVLQLIGSLVTRPLFKEINSIKTSLGLEISVLTPLQIEQKISIHDNKLFSGELSQSASCLMQLSTINPDLVINYASVLLYQVESPNSDSSSKKQILKQILQTFMVEIALLFSNDHALCKTSNHLMYLLSDSIEGLSKFYMGQALSSINQHLFSKQQQSISTVEYFKTLNQLLLIQTDSEVLSLLSTYIYQLLQHAINKHSYADFFQIKHLSQTLQGILLCYKTLIHSPHINTSIMNKTSSLSQTLLTNFVLTQTSQSYLYQMLSKANQKDPLHNLNFAYKKFTDLQLKKNSKLNTDNHHESGIYNLGCICYINSVFQQLYHIDQFSTHILTTPLKQKDNQAYFIQFQKVIYSLKHSKRAFLITTKFCQNYTDYTNQPINIKQQHDADQFLNNLLDKLQKTYQNCYHLNKNDTIVNQSFQGSMSNVITCQNCFTHKPNLQQFYVLSLQIKNQSSLQECLDKMVQPQVICDYYCNTCDKKVNQIHKFRKFHSLPNILFIHFQRLVFDLETFTKIKLDHPINFAQEIDLSNYFYVEQTQPCKYRLLGFIVHFGNSQGGHYISLIKGKQNNSWKKYDDSRITKWFWKTGIHQKDNAYLLIYEKVEETHQNGQGTMDVQKNQNTTFSKFGTQSINQKIIQEITEDNILLGKEITVIRPEFGKFLISELQKSPIPIKQQASEENEDFENDLLKTKLIWKYLRILDEAKAVGFSQALPLKDNELEFLAMKFIQNNRSPQTAQHFLDIAVQVEMVKSLYQSGEKKLRQVFSAILANIVSIWNGYFSQSSYMIPVKENQTIRKLMAQVQNGLSQVGKNYSKMDEYFEFLLVLSRFVPRAKQYFKEMNITAKLVHFIMHKDSKLGQKLGLYPNNAPSNKKTPCFNTIIEIIGFYLEEYPQLQKNDLIKTCLGSKGFEFYRKMYEDRYENYPRLNSILTKFCQNDFELTNKVIDRLILNKINRFSHEDFYIMAYLDLIYCVLTIQDEHKHYRMRQVLGVPSLLVDPNSEQDIMVRKKRQRMVGYWANFITSEDEIIIPFLEHLYNRKQETNYFSLAGTVYLLQMMKEKVHIREYVSELPSPCLLFQSYTSWISEFIKNTLKYLTQNNKQLEKIDIKVMLNKISTLLEEIQSQSGYKQIEDKIEKENTQKICEQKMQEINRNEQVQYLDPSGWKLRNQNFLFGEIVSKSQTRLINQQVLSPETQDEPNPKTLFSIPITYCTLRTIHIKDILAFSATVLSIQDVIQPNQGFSNQLVKKQKTNQLLQTHLIPDQLDNSILQISFSGDNYQLNPFKHKNYALKLQFLHKAYPYEFIISVDSLINGEVKLIVPSPIKQIPDYLAQDKALIDNEVSRSMKICLISLKNLDKSLNSDIMEEQQNPNPQQNKTNKAKHEPLTTKESIKMNLDAILEEYPTIDQVFAYMQEAEQPNNTQGVPKEQVCIECPFCGYISMEFASRCPGCNEEWGYFA